MFSLWPHRHQETHSSASSRNDCSAKLHSGLVFEESCTGTTRSVRWGSTAAVEKKSSFDS